MSYTKEFARYYILYQDNLSEIDKRSLLNFVNEASVPQIKKLLYTGEILEEKPNIFDMDDPDKTSIYDMSKKKKDTIYDPPDRDTIYNMGDKKKSTVHEPGSGETAARKAAKQDVTQTKQKFAKQPLTKGKVVKTAKVAHKNVVKNVPKNIPKNVVKNVPGEAGKKVVAKKGTALAGKTLPTLVIAAAVAAASYAVYKRFLSKSARACSNQSGSAKTLCMQKYKKQATQARIRNMQSQMSKCNTTKDPTKCKAKIAKTISHLKSKV